MAVYCPRCGSRGLADPRFCYMCSDGVADAARAAELVEAVLTGSPEARRNLEDTTDARAFDVVVAAAVHDDVALRRSALIALGGIADERGVPVAAASLDHDDDRVREAAIDALAEMGPSAADAIASRLADPRDRVHAARALAWLHDRRAFEPLELMLDSDTFVDESILGGATIAAMGRLGGADAIAALERAADRVIADADAGVLDWKVRQVASTIAQASVSMRDPAAQAIHDRLATRFGRLYVVPADPLPPFRAPPHPRRTVERLSFELREVGEPVTRPETKFGGQPVWLEAPAWPMGVDGGPATFMAQFALPWHHGLAYLFLDYSAGDVDDQAILLVQPGPTSERSLPWATGPTYWSEIPDATRYVSRMVLRRREALAVLRPGLDMEDWSVLDDDPEAGRDDDRDWNKIGGNPRWLQGDETPDEPGWRFLVQFTAATVGRELGDGAEVYGLVNDDGRARVFVHSH